MGSLENVTRLDMLVDLKDNLVFHHFLQKFPSLIELGLTIIERPDMRYINPFI